MSRKTCRNGLVWQARLAAAEQGRRARLVWQGRRARFVFVAAICLGTMVTSARGGSLDAPAGPTSPASAMYTLENIYNYLTTGVRASKRIGGFTEPTAGPTVGTMHTLNEIMEAGIIPPKTGQTNSYLTGDDGDLPKGRAWPNPRFTVQGDTNAALDPLTNCVLDNLTGLMWTRNANQPNGTKDWTNAIAYCTNMNNGLGTYGYTDWRLPNWNELRSLLDPSKYNPALPAGHPFTGVASDFSTWSSTTDAKDPGYAWPVYLYYGNIVRSTKVTVNYVWPVRGGQ